MEDPLALVPEAEVAEFGTKPTDSANAAFDADAFPSPAGSSSATQPVAVYIQWLIAGTLAGSYAGSYALAFIAERAARFLPDWSHVVGSAALLVLALAAIERAKRDRRPLWFALHALAGLLVILAMVPETLAGYPVSAGWAAVIVVGAYGGFHLLLLEDWLSDRCGPHFRHFAAVLGDLATLRCWVWVSRSALRCRAERFAAEARAAAAGADRRAAEERLARLELEARAARAEQEASAVELHKVEAALRCAAAQKEFAQAQEVAKHYQLEAMQAQLRLEKLRAEYLSAERVVLESAMSARAAAERAVQSDVERRRAEELLDATQGELERWRREFHSKDPPSPPATTSSGPSRAA